MLLCISCKRKWHTNICIQYPVSSRYSIFCYMYKTSDWMTFHLFSSFRIWNRWNILNQFHFTIGTVAMEMEPNEIQINNCNNTYKTQFLFPMYIDIVTCVSCYVYESNPSSILLLKRFVRICDNDDDKLSLVLFYVPYNF